MAAVDIWVMILRFMGDMQEPKAPEPSPEPQKEESFAKRLRGSLGKKLGGKASDQISAEVSDALSLWPSVCVQSMCVSYDEL